MQEKRNFLTNICSIVEVEFLKIRCIHTGDLHIGMEFKNASFDKEYAQKRRMEIWETFNKIIDRAKATEADILLIAGDLFEEDYCSLGDIKRINLRFKDIKNTKVVISAGNHDILGKRSLYKLIEWSENVYIFDTGKINKIEFSDLNTVVWGLSWDKKEIRENLLKDFSIDNRELINILLIHGDVLNKNSEYLPLDKEALIKSGFDYIALGHIHKPQIIDNMIFYCGSPEPLDFGETGEHGIIEGFISKENVDMKFIPFSKRSFIIKILEIKETMGLTEIINKIIDVDDKESRKKNMYRVILKGVRDRHINIDLYEIKENLKDEFFYLEMIDKTNPDYDIDRIYKENKDNIIGYFIESMKKEGLEKPIVKEALYIGLEALLDEKVKI